MKKILNEKYNFDEIDFPLKETYKKNINRIVTFANYYEESNTPEENSLVKNSEENEKIKEENSNDETNKVNSEEKKKVTFNDIQIEFEYPIEQDPPKFQVLIVNGIKKGKKQKVKRAKDDEIDEDLLKRLEETKRQREEFEKLESLRKEEENKKKEIKREMEQLINNDSGFNSKKVRKIKKKQK